MSHGISYGADASGAAASDAASSFNSPPSSASDAAQDGSPTAEDIATVLNVRFHIGLQESLKIGQAVLNAAKRDTISPLLLLAVIAVESNFDRFAVSVVGAKGLMQVLPSQHRDRVLRSADLTDAGTNVSIGSAILHDYIEASDGDVHDALVRYSGGARGYARRVADRMSVIKTAFGNTAHNNAFASPAAFKY
ncbi:lytic transglycosylase domain-containing protein [Trinickia mobilis]|uniref:lytic transglycosylase domain-containing protein n=1 Tax=Trinickia mobilis TaxID=2816356 RepID=UPI001A8FB96C|nr:lytic transglycosylase domain-containing protein [Trinickia mobilis]